MVLSDVEQSHLRYALRVYFIAGMFILAIIGSQCCKLAAKLDLLKGRPVRLHRMTGWLHPKELFFCIWKLRQLPGGWWLGLMMIVAGIVTIAADFATNSIKAVPVESRCPFDRGLVPSLNTSQLYFDSPPTGGYPVTLAANAQSVSVQLGCDDGIYKKIPGYQDLHFCAGEEDVYGKWECEDLNKDHTFDPSVRPYGIIDYMRENDIHITQSYRNVSYIDEINYATNETAHLILWSAWWGPDLVTPESHYYPTHIRLSVDLGFDYSKPKTMKSFECNITSANPNYENGLNEIFSAIDFTQVFDTWIGGLKGMIYNGTGAPANPDINLLRANVSQYLNTMTMIQGSGNFVINTTLPGDEPFYGCITMKTNLNDGVIFLACFSGLILLITFTYYITLLALLGKHGIPSLCRRSSDDDRELNLATVPSSTIGWMLHASRERSIGLNPEEIERLVGVPKAEEDLRDWHFMLVDAGKGHLRLVRTAGGEDSNLTSVEQIPLSIDPKRSQTFS